MPDEVMQELWQSKDRIAREHGYEIDALVSYLQGKESQRDPQGVDPSATPETAERNAPTDARTSHGQGV